MPARVGRARRRWLAVVALNAALAVAGCADASPSPTAVPSPPVAPSPSAPAPVATPLPGARLAIEATGEIRCLVPFGCAPILGIVPIAGQATLPPDWFDEPTVRFDHDLANVADDGWIVGSAIDAPATIGPGIYLVVGAVTILSDVSSEAPSGSGRVVPVLGANTCEAPLTVDAGTTDVRIVVSFEIEPACRVTVETTSGPP